MRPSSFNSAWALARLLEAKTDEASHVNSPPFADRRRERRIMTDVRAQLHVLEGTGAGIACQILDTSKNGLKIRISEYAAPGTLVQICTENLFIMAVVRHCEEREGTYVIGVEIENAVLIPVGKSRAAANEGGAK